MAKRFYTERSARSAIRKSISKEKSGKIVEQAAIQLLLTNPDLSPKDAIEMGNCLLNAVNKELKRSINRKRYPLSDRKKLEAEILCSTLLDIFGGIDETEKEGA